MGGGAGRPDAIDPHLPGDVLQFLLADILEGEVEAAGGVLLDPRRDADAAGLGEAFEPGGDIDPVAEDVAVLDDDVALVDADAELEALFRRGRGVAFGHRALPLGGAAQRVDDAGELDEEPVAGGFDDAPLMLGDARVDQFAPQRLERRQRPFLVLPDEPRIAGDIGGEDRRQPPFYPPLGHRIGLLRERHHIAVLRC